MSKPLASHMTVRPECMGVEGLMCPGIDKTSSQRAGMVSSQLGQPVVLLNAERPRWRSGFETHVGEYSFEHIRIRDNIQIHKTIPRYKGMMRFNGASPSMVVIYKTLDKPYRAGYYELKHCTVGAGGFGYLNKWGSPLFRSEHQQIPKGETISPTHAPNQDGDEWNYGRNLKVLTLTESGTDNDAFIISEEVQQQLKYTAVHKIRIDVPEKSIPLNLYGDEDNYKIMPGILENVRSDGTLMCLRDMSDPATFLYNMDARSFSPQEHDDTFPVKPGARIMDVQVHLASSFKPNSEEEVIYKQLLDYNEQQTEFYKTIVYTYFELMQQNCQPDSKFASLVEHAIEMLCVENYRHKVYMKGEAGQKLRSLFKSGNRKRKIIPMDGRVPIKFATVDIVYAYDTVPKEGAKLTGRYGNKGVISAIRKKEHMPIDERGVRADMIYCPKGAFNRVNPGQLEEAFLTRAAEEVRMQIIEQSMTYEAAWLHVMDFLNEVWAPYAEIVANTHPTPEKRAMLIEEIKSDGINLTSLPMIDVDSEVRCDRIVEKFNVRPSPVTFVYVDEEGNEHVETTNVNCLIGYNYMMLLCKDPEYQLYGVGLAHVSQFELPIRASQTAKKRAVIKETPIRFGEDEFSLLIASVGSEETMRLMLGTSGSPETVKQETETLLTHPNPTQIRRFPISTASMVKTSNQIRLLEHMAGVTGFGIAD